MSKVGESLMAGLQEALAHARGEPVPGLRIHVIEVPVADDADAAASPGSGDGHTAIHASARALHKVGAIDAKAMAEFDESCGVKPPDAERPRSHPRR